MTALKFGFVIVEGCGEQASIAEHTLRRLTEVEGEVEYRTVPGTSDIMTFKADSMHLSASGRGAPARLYTQESL